MPLKNIPAIITTCFVWCTAFTQTIEKNLFNWSQISPIEKVYMHTDRQSYTSGQTIWFKAYFLSDFIPSPKSTSLYTELLNSDGEIIQRKVFPAFMSESYGQIDIEEDLVTGNYQLRAYSPIMLNHPGFYYSSKITIFGKEPKLSAQKQSSAAIDLNFFPEGGNLIRNLMNNVAFKAVDQYGLPVNVTINVKNNKEELITTTTSIHDGMGIFSIVPQPGETYYAIINSHNGQQKFPLPASTDRGVVLIIRPSAKGILFKIEQQPDNEIFKAAYMIGQMQNTVVFRQNFSTGKNLFGGTIQTSNMLSGILHITVFNKDNLPLAQRIVFIDNKEYVLPATFTADTVNIGERKRNHYSIALKDTVIGNFSVSVTDADYEISDTRAQNIVSYFLLNSDLKGYIHHPAWYFSGKEKTAAALDLVMMTNGWTRFKWEDAVKNTLPTPMYKDNALISIRGRVNIEGTKKPFADKELLYFMMPADTALRRYSMPRFLKTDSAGRFAIDSQVFFNRMNILFSDTKGRKSKFIKVKLDGDSLYKPYNLPLYKIPFTDTLNSVSATKLSDAYNEYIKAEGLTLATVTVKARVKSNQELLEEKYSSGLFSGSINSRIIDLTNETTGSLNIFEYLQGRVPGLTVTRDTENGYVLTYRDGGLGKNKVTLYLDEVQTDASFIESIPINQIAFIKMMGTFVGTMGGGSALAIYMKKGTDLNAVTESATDIITYNGYSIIKQFYNPDYSVKRPEDTKVDRRLTLFWQPSIYLSHVDPVIPIEFYNNDRTKKFKIVAEGVTNDGRFLMIEKIVTP